MEGEAVGAGGQALALEAISKRFGATVALDGVDLTLGRGEVVALMGANGAGKSTLVKIASGVIEPDEGQIRFASRPIRFASPKAARAIGIVTVHQSTDQLGVPGLSVAENLVLDELCGGRFGMLAGAAQIRRRARTVAAALELDLPLERDFGELGPAQRQLIAIARAAAADAALLIFDEPTASLSASEADRLFEIVDRLRARGVAVLYISHRLGDIRRLADRVVVLRNGRVVADRARPFDLAEIIKAMIGRDLHAEAGDRGVEPASAPVLEIADARLIPGAPPFDLTVRAGEIIAVTGALGSGKSRLLATLFGLAKLAEGRLHLEGVTWQPRSPAEAIAGGVFMAAEDRWRSSLLPPMTPGATIAGTIALPHRRSWFPLGLVRPQVESSIARRAIDRLGIRCRGASDTLDLLSGGNQQKVVLARWQAAPCRLLLLDEPFQGVDVGAREDLVDAIRTARSGAATLIATSDVEEAMEVADTIAVMRDHSIVAIHRRGEQEAASLLAAIGAVEDSQTADVP